MEEYNAYIQSLDSLLESSMQGKQCIQNEIINRHLNGGADKELRRLINRSQLHNSGAFFTGEELGRRLVGLLPEAHRKDSPAWDPCCGAGDLLLRWSENLSIINNDLSSTLDFWGEMIHGVEIHPEFIQAAKRRLALAAIARGARLKRGGLRKIDSYFPNLINRDLFNSKVSVPTSATTLMNPPFTMIETPDDCANWTSGKVTFAAVAFLSCLNAARNGQRILAILPDVLRSGSRYDKWRNIVERNCSDGAVQIVGRFGKGVDVDVFIINASAGDDSGSRIKWSFEKSTSSGKIGDICDVHVGSVVPHRLKQSGKWMRYLTAANAPAWGGVSNDLPSIRYSGTCVAGPFIAVRRTSSPSDRMRAIATIVSTNSPVAVENHMISIRPRDGRMSTCRSVLKTLKSQRVQDWIDERIRCRHLTLDVIRGIPIND